MELFQRFRRVPPNSFPSNTSIGNRMTHYRCPKLAVHSADDRQEPTAAACPQRERKPTACQSDDPIHASPATFSPVTVREKVHRPAFVGSRGHHAVFATLGRHPPLRRLLAQLQGPHHGVHFTREVTPKYIVAASGNVPFSEYRNGRKRPVVRNRAEWHRKPGITMVRRRGDDPLAITLAAGL